MKKRAFPFLTLCLRRCGYLRLAVHVSGVWLGGSLPLEAGVREAWVQRYTNTVADTEDVASTVVHDKEGNFIVTGSTRQKGLGQDAVVFKYSAKNGSVLWQKRFNGKGNGVDAFTTAAVDGNDNVVVAGYSSNGNDCDYYVAKYASADGALIWEMRYDGPANGRDQITAVAVDGSGNVLVTGTSGPDDYDDDYYQGDCYTAKYAAADGALLWERRIPHAPNRATLRPPVLAVDAAGNAVVADFVENHGNRDICTIKYAAADGATLWERRFDGPGEGLDFANAVAVDREGNAVVAGSTTGADNKGMEFYTAKYAAANGTVIWEKRHAGLVAAEDGAKAVAVDGSGNVIVTGRSIEFLRGDFYTAKYAAADGALLWERRYEGVLVGNGADYGDDGPLALALDPHGDVIVTGYSRDGVDDHQTDYYTARYAAGDGAVLWEKRYNGPQNARDTPVAVTVNSHGNVAVAGSSTSGQDADIYTACYAGGDGMLFWEQRYSGLSQGMSNGQAVRVDKKSNVIVSGSSEADDTGFDFLTTKYSPAGAILWQRRHDGPAHGDDRVASLALDAGGNVVVTGFSAGEYCTVKYAAADGTLLWEHRYSGLGISGGQP